MLCVGWSRYYQVGHGIIRLVSLLSGWSRYYWVGCAIIGPVTLLMALFGVLSLPAVIPLLAHPLPTLSAKV